MLRKPFMVVFIRLQGLARWQPFRFEMSYRTWENPSTMNRGPSMGDENSYLIKLNLETNDDYVL